MNYVYKQKTSVLGMAELGLERRGVLDRGELIMYSHGVCLRMPYESGQVFVAETGDRGVVEVRVNDILAESFNPDVYGKKMLEELQRPDVVRGVQESLVRNNQLYLVCAKAGSFGLDVIAVPGSCAGEYVVKELPNDDCVVAAYCTGKGFPSLERVLSFHDVAVRHAKKSLVRNKDLVAKETVRLVTLANQLAREIGK